MRRRTFRNYMRKITLILALAALILCQGCDAFRFLAGRPTSADLEAKRAVIEAARAEREKTVQDSIALVRKQEADSLAAVDSLNRMKNSVMSYSSLGGDSGSRPEHVYYIIIGAFMDRANAEYMLKTVVSAGYQAELINFRNGYVAVALCPSDSIVTAFDNLKKLKNEKFCPADAWILVNK